MQLLNFFLVVNKNFPKISRELQKFPGNCRAMRFTGISRDFPGGISREPALSSSFIGWNFHLHTDENGSISASEASRFFSNATRVDEEKKLVRRVANVAASAPGSLCCSDLSRLDSASTEYDLCRRRKKLLIWA